MDDHALVAALLAAAGFDADDNETSAAAGMYVIVRSAVEVVAALAKADIGPTDLSS